VTRYARPGGEDELAVPELTDADWCLAALTALISAIPLGGHMANEFMRLVGSPIERRRKLPNARAIDNKFLSIGK
jgi:hypothetical protein